VAKKINKADEGFLTSKILALLDPDETFSGFDEGGSFFSDSAALRFAGPDEIPNAPGIAGELPSHAMPDLSAGAFHTEASASVDAFLQTLASDTLLFKFVTRIQTILSSAPEHATQSTVAEWQFAELFAQGSAAGAGDAQAPSAVQAAATHAQTASEAPGLDLPGRLSVLFDAHAGAQAAQGDTLWFV
jgi:hypothetical protein